MLYFQGFLKVVHLPIPCSFGFWKTHTWVDPKTKRSLCCSSTFVLTNSENWFFLKRNDNLGLRIGKRRAALERWEHLWGDGITVDQNSAVFLARFYEHLWWKILSMQQYFNRTKISLGFFSIFLCSILSRRLEKRYDFC